MLHIDITNGGNLPQTARHAVHLISRLPQNRLPGIFLLSRYAHAA